MYTGFGSIIGGQNWQWLRIGGFERNWLFSFHLHENGGAK